MSFSKEDEQIELITEPVGIEELEQLLEETEQLEKAENEVKKFLDEQEREEQKQEKTKRQLPTWVDRPYHVWRDKFQKDKCCPKKLVWKELFDDSFYFVWLNVSVICFIISGALIINLRFLSSDDEPNFWESCLFCLTTISTIGYGNIVPNGDLAKYLTIGYCCIGIPLFFMTLALNSIVLIDLCNIILVSFKPKATISSEISWPASAALLGLHCLIGAFMFSFWIDDLDFFDAFYFSFISIATIGYGDFSPTPEGPIQFLAVFLYLAAGVSIMLIFFAQLQRVILWIHYYGRGVSDSEELEFKVGGRMVTVGDLVLEIAEKMDTTPEKLHTVLLDLDKILQVACREAEGADILAEEELVRHEDSPVGDKTVRKKTVLLHSVSAEEDQNQLTVHSFTGSNQRTIPKGTEEAIQALAAIQHHLRKPSVRVKQNSKVVNFQRARGAVRPGPRIIIEDCVDESEPAGRSAEETRNDRSESVI